MTVKFTLMPVSAVKFSAVNCCRSTIWGSLTISTLMVSGPPPAGPPPQPAHPLTVSASAVATARAGVARRRSRTVHSPGEGHVGSAGHGRRHGPLPDRAAQRLRSYERRLPHLCDGSLLLHSLSVNPSAIVRGLVLS